MAAKTTKAAAYEQMHDDDTDDKAGTSRNWLTRHLLRSTTRQDENEDVLGLGPPTPTFLARPRTAPSSGTPNKQFLVEPMPMPMPNKQFIVEPPLARPLNKPPPRPPRPDSEVIRDVNAWLDASTTKTGPPQLMAGLSYWREGAFTGAGPSTDVRYAIPIIANAEMDRPAATHSQHLKSFCRRAKKIQVRMPSLLQTKSQRTTVKSQTDKRRSTSMPLLSIHHDHDEGMALPPRPLARSRSLVQIASNCSTPASILTPVGGWIRPAQQLSGPSQRHDSPMSPRFHDSPMSPRFDDQESSMERRVNAVFGQTARAGDTVRATHGHRIPREDSMGNLSDAPTYFSGPPPPSYRSRAASIRTTSSFGCIDGMGPARRQHDQQRAAQRGRGVKGKFKKLAQKAHLKK